MAFFITMRTHKIDVYYTWKYLTLPIIMEYMEFQINPIRETTVNKESFGAPNFCAHKILSLEMNTNYYDFAE